jgi:hypothetical protein
MLGRKKYRKGKTYMFVAGGVYSSGLYGTTQDKIFLNANALRLNESLSALEMFQEVTAFVKNANNVPKDTSVFINLYHVESD